MNYKAVISQLITIYNKRGFIFLFLFFVNAINDAIIKRYLYGSFSQKGEDLVIENIVGNKRNGFYIDVGAHNPNIYNNTKRFYEKGWDGINIEPNPNLIKEFQKQRNRDVNLNIGVKIQTGKAKFYEFEASPLSTFSKDEKVKNIKLGYKFKRELIIPVWNLKKIIEKYGKSPIDFITIDTEGLDLEVLQSNDWNKYRPKVVCIETGDFSSLIIGDKSNKKNMIDSFMFKNGYKEYYDNNLNTIYLNNKA
jgi:FkbM family methyltransferase